MRRRASLWTQFPGDRAGQMHRWLSTEDRGQTSVLRRVLSSPLKMPAMQEQDLKREQGEPRKELVWGGIRTLTPIHSWVRTSQTAPVGSRGGRLSSPRCGPQTALIPQPGAPASLGRDVSGGTRPPPTKRWLQGGISAPSLTLSFLS